MEIYFDNAATTKPFKEVIEKCSEMLENCYGNSSSQHSMGLASQKEIMKSKKTIADILGVLPDEFIFTSGGTESNNLAIAGIAESNMRRGKHIITCKTEHSSVLEVFKHLSQIGFDVTFLDVDSKGYINLKELASAITDKTTLVSIMHVNNETGTIQNINEIGRTIKEKDNSIFYHVDGVQSFCKCEESLKYVDAYSFSSHKIHGLKGVGGLYVRKGTKIKPIQYSSPVPNPLRPGTENSIGIACFGLAAEICKKNMIDTNTKLKQIKNYIVENLQRQINFNVNGDYENGAPSILNINIPGIHGEILLRALDERGIYISNGSACNGKDTSKSILKHYHLTNEEVISSIRISFSEFNSLAEAEIFTKELVEQVNILLKFRR